MGGSISSSSPQRGPEKIGEGLYGVVYRNSDGSLTKKQKLKGSIPEKNTDLWRELRAYDWIDTIKDARFKNFFAVRISYTIHLDQEYKHMPDWIKIREERIRSDPDSVPDGDKNWIADNLKEISKSNAFPYTCDLVIQNKGRAPSPANADPTRVHKALRQALEIIDYMQKEEVIHSDLHIMNFVIQPSGDIALIDYGSVHLRDDDFYQKHKAEHLMMAQITSMMVDVGNNFEIEESLKDARSVTTIEQRITTALSVGDNEEFLKAACEKIGYANPISKARNNPGNHDLVVSILLNRTKVRYPEQFKAMMGWPAAVILHSHVSADMLDFVYMHISDIPEIVRHFQ